MNITRLQEASELFMPAWESADRRSRSAKAKTEQQDTAEAFCNAVRACDKESERMMDRHHESVAKSAKERAVYNKKKAISDRAIIEARKQDVFNETVMIQRINHRNMLKENLMEDLKQREINKAVQN